jgi:Winged helix DNA-binding domain
MPRAALLSIHARLEPTTPRRGRTRPWSSCGGRIYGPTTPEAFARWAGIRPRHGVAAFQALGRSLTPVHTPVGDAWILSRDEPTLRAAPGPAAPARLLPSGDAYLLLLQGADRELLVPDTDRRRALGTPRVWPGGLLVDGEIVGTWRRADAAMTMQPWRPLSRVPESLTCYGRRLGARARNLDGSLGSIHDRGSWGSGRGPKYARNGDVHLAFQAIGDGPLDLLLIDTWVHHVEAVWDFPDFARFLRRLSSFGRLIHFDRRGTGLSDPVPLDQLPDLETQVGDAVAVLKAAGSDGAAVIGLNDGTLFAATPSQPL